MDRIDINYTINYLEDNELEDLAYLIRKTWNNKPKNNKETRMWEEQLSLNLPILFLASIDLHKFAQKNEIKNFLFVRRDCCHWWKIYNALYPKSKVYYVHCSRKMLEKSTNENHKYYNNYIDHITDSDSKHSIYVDVHGTGLRMYNYFDKREKPIPLCYILSSSHSSIGTMEDNMELHVKNGLAKFIVFEAAGSPIEMLNYDITGTCLDFDSNGPIRAPVEYDPDIVLPYHDCCREFLRVIDNYPNKLKSPKQLSSKSIIKIINHLYKPILDNKPIISQWIVPERKH